METGSHIHQETGPRRKTAEEKPVLFDTAPIEEVIDVFSQCKDENSSFQDLPQETVTVLMERVFSDETTSDERFLGELGFFGGAVPETRGEDKRDRDLLCDKIMNSLAILYRKYPEQVSDFYQSFGQQAQMLRFDTYLSASLAMLADPKLPGNLRGDLVAGLNYQATFNYLGRLQAEMATAQGIRGGQTLDLIDLTAREGSNWAFSEDASAQLRETMVSIAETSDNYYVAKRAGGIARRFNFTEGW
ncbi:MAG TPA: hypothetical protein DDW36_01370, partial [Candidatus Magasanikbacteria bacterium]|nr:hypothetical protein [Candidatus Magasanikbacteria bacterium]